MKSLLFVAGVGLFLGNLAGISSQLSWAEGPISGTWLQVECKEGYVGEDAPPPEYSKGVLRFGEGNTLYLSSVLYDDDHCVAARPQRSKHELPVSYSLPSVETTDGSVAIDVQWPDAAGGSVPLYGLMKVVDGRLYLSLYPEASQRPKAIHLARATVFVTK